MATAALAGIAMLIIGESHMSFDDHLINPLVNDLTAQGAKVHAIGACGAHAADWLKTITVKCSAERRSGEKGVFRTGSGETTPIKQLIAKDKPDLVLIIIGDTMGSYDKDVFPRAWAWKSVTDLTKGIASTKTTCVWVGPAYGTEGGSYFKNQKRTEELSKFFSQNVAPCGYIDSLKFSKPGEWRTLDGQHYAPAGYKLWSAAITKALIEMPMVQQLRKK